MPIPTDFSVSLGAAHPTPADVPLFCSGEACLAQDVVNLTR